MPDAISPDALAATALVPEQLYGYVRSVSGSRFEPFHGFAVYPVESGAVFTGYPDESGLAGFMADPGAFERELVESVGAYARERGPDSLTLLAPVAPTLDLEGYEREEAGRDIYQSLELPWFGEGWRAPAQKLRNMLNRAGRDIVCEQGEWSADCAALVSSVIATRPFSPGTRYIFGRMGPYLAEVPQARLFTARRKDDARLEAFCIGDFTALSTAFYLFAFRRADAVPGAADLLLAALVREAQEQGYARVNLGLAINGGIGFFKKKWGAADFLPYIETVWKKKRKKGFFSSFFGS